jgi:hypothetical protein
MLPILDFANDSIEISKSQQSYCFATVLLARVAEYLYEESRHVSSLEKVRKALEKEQKTSEKDEKVTGIQVD